MKGSSRSGQSFVELMVAIAIGAIFTVGAAMIIAPSLSESGQAGKIQTGATLAQSLLNNARVWSEGNWNNILSLSTGTASHYYLVTSSSPYTATSGIQSVVIGTTTYTDYFYLVDAYRDGNGDLTSASSGNTYDPSTKQIVAVYNWTHGTTSTISTYVTRNEDKVFYQTDWSGGGTSTVATSVGNQFGSSSNIDYASTTGAIYVAVSGGGCSGICLIQQTSSYNNGTSVTISFPSNTTTGDFIIVAIGDDGASSLPTDSQGDTFKTALNATAWGPGEYYSVYYAENIHGGTVTVSSTFSPYNTAGISIFEYSGVATSNSLDATSTTTGTGTLTNSGNLTTTGSADLLFGISMDDAGTIDQTYTSNNGFTTLTSLGNNDYQDLGTQEKILSSTATASSSFTLGTSGDWGQGIAAFK